MKTAIITGITGQDGAYLAQFLITKGYKVIGLTRGYNNYSLSTLEYLKIKDHIIIEECNSSDFTSVLNVIKKYNPDEIYNLTSQSAVGLSFKHPIDTFNSNVITVLNLLEAVKMFNTGIKVFQPSSTEMFGKANCLPVTENTNLAPITPYGISKVSAQMICHCYKNNYNMFVCCGILSNHESYIRKETFVIKKIIKTACEVYLGKSKSLEVGNIQTKRDFGYAPKYVEAMWLIMQQPKPDDYMICSGKSYSIKEIIERVFNNLSLPMSALSINPEFYRPDEIPDMYGDNSKIKKIGWDYDLDFMDVLTLLVREELQNME